MKKFGLYIIILIFSACSSTKFKNNLIGVYFHNHANSYMYKQIKNKLKEIGFKHNYKIVFKTRTENMKQDFQEFYKAKTPVVIVEENDIANLEKIYKLLSRKRIKVALVTENITNTKYCDHLFSTDFFDIGRKLADILYNSTRRKRNTFVLYLNKKSSIAQTRLIQGISSFLKDHYISIWTNYYSNSQEFDRISLVSNINKWTNDLRGILVDDDRYAVPMAKELRLMGKDNEIKLASFGATIDGINCILKTEIVASGDINKLSIFTNAINFLINISESDTAYTQKIIYYDVGVCYNQINVMDLLAQTKKYSIKDILITDRRKPVSPVQPVP